MTDLLPDLVARLDASGGLSVVMDVANALAAGVRRVVFSERAPIRRLTLHKRRNVTGYLSKELAGRIDRRLAQAFSQPDPAQGLSAHRA